MKPKSSDVQERAISFVFYLNKWTKIARCTVRVSVSGKKPPPKDHVSSEALAFHKINGDQ